ncbi:MAG: hypothetical protein GX235_04115 [Clostridiales bacterium]|nr:hypothetical protein [Clostridiales bacterium]
MSKNKKVIIAIAVAILVVAAFFTFLLRTAGADTDVIGKGSVASFENVLQKMSDSVKVDETNSGYSLEAPDGTVRFVWSANYDQSPLYDAMLEFDIQPFIDAGLDMGKLPDNYTLLGDKMAAGTDFDVEGLKFNDISTPLAAYKQIVDNYRSAINYHSAMDHYGVKLGGGNMFEWAKDMEINSVTGDNQDKDIVFVLDPESLIAAGVSPDNVEGWAYETVKVEENGKMIEVYKFLKPFDLNK